MEEHCPQPGLPAREDFVIIAEALSQVSQVTRANKIAKNMLLLPVYRK